MTGKQIKGNDHKKNTFKDSQINISSSGIESPDSVDTVFITLPCQEAKEGKLVLLVDTGADSSIVKEEAMNGLRNGSKKDVRKLAGAFGGSASTLGAIEVHAVGRNVPWTFHIVAQGSGVPGDGVLGRDNIWGRSVINSMTRTLKIFQNNKLVKTFSLRNERASVELTGSKNFLVKERTITMVPVNLKTKEKTVVIHKQQLSPGVYVGNTIVNVRNGNAVIPILNATEENMPVGENMKIQFSRLNHYTVHKETETLKTPIIDRTERIRELKKILMNEKNWNEEERASMSTICEKYHDVFMLLGDKLPFTTLIKHKIPTKLDQPPINQKQYRLPHVHKDEINQQVSELLKEGVIAPSTSPWNSPLLLVPKKSQDGKEKFRMVVDFRKLNDVTIKQVFPIPRIDEILDQLGNSRYFTTLDLASGYHQVLLDKEDKKKTAFSTDKGHFEFNRMPFGLTGAPATFQRVMNTILTGLQGLDCFVYLDDIVIYGRNVADHEKKVNNVLSRLRESGLKLNTGKCQFLRREIVYLGHKCSEKGALPDPAKVESVKRLKPPKSIKEVQALLGLVNYYRKFVKGMAELASPITRLLRKNYKFAWTKECQEAFSKIKERITNPPILIYPDFSEPFRVTTDASNEALGAVLSQLRDGKDHPIAFASRTLSDTEKRYSTIEKEMLGIVWATRTFRHYLLGRPFTVFTDHQPLRGIANLKDQTSRLARFRHKLSEYEFDIVYKPGKTNLNADALSRLPLEDQKIQVVTRAQAKELNKTKTPSNEVASEERSPEENFSMEHRDAVEILTDRKDIEEVLRSFHDSPLGGHQGVWKTIRRVGRQYRWKGMQRDIKNYIRKCQKCQKNKCGPVGKEQMVLTDTPQRPFEKVYMDMVGPLPTTTAGNKYILTFQDDLSKFFICAPMPDAEAETVARIFYNEIITKYGIPTKLITDNGTNFTSKLFGSVCKLLKIKKQHITPYHPQANGSLERSHRPLAEYLRSFAKEDGSNWDQWLPPAMHVHNHTDHAATNQTPFRVLYGFDTPLPSNLKVSTPLYNPYDYPKVLKYQIQRAYEMARKHQTKAKIKAKERYDKNAKNSTIHIGDQVLLRNQTRTNKLSPLWEGPYKVIGIPSPVNVQILAKGKQKILHRNLVKLYRQSTEQMELTDKSPASTSNKLLLVDDAQKRLPLSSETSRSHSDSGSSSKLQYPRHNSDLDNCNPSIPSNGSGSLTHTPCRNSGPTASKVITSNYSSASTADTSKKNLTFISGSHCDNIEDNCVHTSAALRSVLLPPSPTSSHYYNRDSSGTLLTSTTSHNSMDDNKGSTASDEDTEVLCGLRNIGNTCFMNSIIQCLSHTNELAKFLRNHNAMKFPTSKSQQILYEFSKLIKEMWKSNVKTVAPMELKRALSAKHRMYSDYNQQDAQEFLRLLLDSLHGTLNTGKRGEHLKIDDSLIDKKKGELTWELYGLHENSLIRDLFGGQLKSTLRCTTCGNTSVTFDSFWDLSIPLPSSSSCKLDACLDLFIREEVLDGDDMPTCSKCQTRRKCTKSFTIQHFPKYLVIHLKRFSEICGSKLSNIVEFPTGERELNMGPYDANGNSDVYYSLYGVSNHIGSTAGGHYVAICKHPVSRKWHEFNDNLVSDSLSEHNLVSSSAYILFYERA